MADVSIFPTDLGWFVLLGSRTCVHRLGIGYAEQNDARAFAQASRTQNCDTSETICERDWFPELRRELEQYARGKPVDFQSYVVQWVNRTEFQSRVIDAVRSIGYGERLSYAEVAQRAGSPNAARAVGNVMRSNPVPLLIPCHRVIASGGKWGGFSAPTGVALKRRLLEMESHSATSVNSRSPSGHSRPEPTDVRLVACK